MISVSETVRGTHIYIFFPPRSCNCRFKIYARSLKYGYLTIGGTVCSCIRFCTQTDMFPPPPSQVWAGYERKGKPSIGTESLMHPSPVRCTLQSAGRSLTKNMHRVSAQGLSKQLPIFCCKSADQHVRIRSMYVNVRKHPVVCGQVINCVRCVQKIHLLLAQLYQRATVQDVYAVYRIRVISQNSRRKAIAEG